MSIAKSASRFERARADASASAETLVAADLAVNGTRAADDAGDDASLEKTKIGAAEVIGGATFVTKLASLALGRYITTLEASHASELRNFNRNVSIVESSSDKASVVALVGGVLPAPVGLAISRSQLKRIVEGIGNTADRVGDLTSPLVDSLESSIKTFKSVKYYVDYVNLALALTGGVIVTTKIFGAMAADAGDGAQASVTEAKLGAGALSDDFRMEAGFEALGLRFEAATMEVRAASETVEAFVAPVETVYDEQLLPAFEAIASAAEDIAALTAPLQVLDGAKAAADSFGKAVDVIYAPLEAIFDFLGNPPKVPILNKPIFPPIPRSAIDDIIDFFETISSAIDAAFDLVFGKLVDPIITKVQDFINNKLFNFGIYEDALGEIREIVDRMLDALKGIDVPTADFSDVLDPVLEIGSFSTKAFAAEEGDKRATFFGGPEDDVVEGAAGGGTGKRNDIPGAVLSGGGGRDDLTGTGLQDMLMGGEAADVLKGLAGPDAILGGGGNDEIDGGRGSDAIDGGEGFDVAVFSGPRARYEISAEDGLVKVRGPDGVDSLVNVETLRFADAEVNAAFFAPSTGGATGDVISRRGGRADDLKGLGGDDVIRSAGGDDQVRGGRGDDRIIAGAGDDDVFGGGGRDRMLGGGGDDALFGNGGADVARGGGGDDRIIGGPGPDRLFGGAGEDWLAGGPGDDMLFGGAGADVIIAGPGDDVLAGGAHADKFFFRPSDGSNVISDFGLGADVIVLKAAGGMGDLDISRSGGDAVIEFRGLSILLEGVAPREVDADDFIF